MLFSRFDKILVVSLIVIVGIILVSAVDVNPSKPWHILQQVAVSGIDPTSVDSDGDGKIDSANNAVHAVNADNATMIKCPTGDYKESKDCGFGGGSTVPNCASGEFLKRNSAGDGWECVDTVVNNQIASVPVANFNEYSYNSLVYCSDVNPSNASLLFDGSYSNAIYCQDKSNDDSQNHMAGIIVDLGSIVRNGLVYVDATLKRTAAETGANCGDLPVHVYIDASMDGTNYTNIDSVSTREDSFVEFIASGTFIGKYLRVRVHGPTNMCPSTGGAYYTSKGEFYINELQIFSFTE
jgi:hypothetical protein